MRQALVLLLLFFCISTAPAQTPGNATSGAPPNRATFRGTVIDSGGAVLPGATVMLLTPRDSTLISYGRTNEKGVFEFKNVKRSTYLLKATFVGYIPHQQLVNPGSDAVFDAGTIRLKPLSKELMEVVVKTAKAPLTIRGDTVEYNAASFKVPPGATVEDLLRKLPGVEVDQEGNIKSQGQDVKRVTVDGKTFFGNDPKLATKNLPADALSKVQVFSSATEQSKITGVEDGKKEKTMNLELKESARKGGFGKVTAGAGPASNGVSPRAEVKGNYNRFDKKQQFSLIGFGNNTNQTGVSFDDYQDFRGSQAFNWGDDGDFGFSNDRSFYIGGDDNSFSIPLGSRGRGFSNSAAGGANYNYDTKKNKLSGSYFYNQTNQTTQTLSERKSLLENNSFVMNDSSKLGTFSSIHRLNLRYEQNIDSLNTLIAIFNARNNIGTSQTNDFQDFYLDQNKTIHDSQTSLNNTSDYTAFALTSSLLYRHKFRKKGRNFAASLSYNLTNNDADGFQSSVNSFYRTPQRDTSFTSTIRQQTSTISHRGELKSSLFYVEPLSKRFFLESFYNFSLRRDEVDKDVFDLGVDGQLNQRNQFLSRYYVNDYFFNRLGTSLRYNNKGLNLSAGLAAQQFQLTGKFAPDQTSTEFTRVNRSYFTVVPNASLSYDLKNNRYLSGSYSVQVSQPSTRDLQPVIDNSNPRYITEGNPDLLPALTHNLRASYNMFNPASFTNVYFSLNYGYNINQIVYNQTVDELLITRTKPTNISGGYNVGSYAGFGFPLKKTKSNLNVNANVNLANNLAYINNVLNRTNSNSYGFGLRLDLTPSDKFTLYTNANYNITDTRYSINTSQNQLIYNQNYGAEMNVQLPKSTYFNANFNDRIYINDRFGFNQNVPILNLSVYKLFLKDKKGELRLTAYDVFNRNLTVNQSASQNYVTTERVQTLARYFMLSFTYNMRGVKAQMRRQGF